MFVIFDKKAAYFGYALQLTILYFDQSIFGGTPAQGWGPFFKKIGIFET